MSIVIDSPTAEAVWQAIQQLPQDELARLKHLLDTAPVAPALPVDESTEWSDEDLSDFSAAGLALYEEIEANELKNAQAR